MFLKKGVLKIYSKFTEEHPCRSGISMQLQSNFIEIALWDGCSLVNLLHIFRTSSPRNASGWLLLNICITYLYVTEACLKFTFAMVNFCHSENPSSFMKNVFNSISIYSWKNRFEKNIRNKCVTRKVNLYFLTSWKMAKFFLQKFAICLKTDFFLIEKWGTLEVARR